MKTRPLTENEIAALERQGCFSSSWSSITVPDNFQPGVIRNVQFSGDVSLGLLGGVIRTQNGEVKESGLYNSRIENCEIGNEILIRDVGLVKNYRIMDRVILENVDVISVDGPSAFGNGTEIDVLNEGGGRELLLFDGLSAQMAYMLVSYRHDPELIETMNGMIREYVRIRTSQTGCIGTETEIIHSGSLYNLDIGEHAVIRGAALLENGTVKSNRFAPVFIGGNVIAKSFMIMSGSRLDTGALIEKCFVGQGVEIGKQFSAENSVFFANSEGYLSEAVSVFAGPYTVTHHRSSLLIAGMFSFYNAGSGTNQSNHMYKLGPVHQGIIERGSKTGSFAYLLWPSRIGPFSVVMGKNMASFDTSDFPFSYINVDQERSILTPGMNLITVGTRRDSEKWPLRDRRKDPEKSDLINFEFLNPYLIQKVISGLNILKELYEKTPQQQEFILYKGIRIKRLMLKSTQRYYKLVLSIFIGNQIIRKLEKLKSFDSIESVRKALSCSKGQMDDRWVDMAGMIAPRKAVQDLISSIKSGKVMGLDDILSGLSQIHDSYELFAWNWTTGVIEELQGIDIGRADTGQLIELINQWETDFIRLDKMILNDAAKEFDTTSRIGFGIDGDEEVVKQDFEAIRGKAVDNKFIAGINREIDQIGIRAARLRELLEKIQS
jgi:NDP-sugar pyrophosphorylase family protein